MEPEIRKRRSTRIVQAVPLVVAGVDALGRPFQEHTSTLIINCHGARYQSKHYVLKNMWVTLEVPHPEPAHEPRSVRGKVAWIQRPRSVRQLFQIALELENPGNVWGIAFPPEDWFPFGENQALQTIAEPVSGMPMQTAQQHEEGFMVDNVHFMPVSEAVDALQALRLQVNHLIADAHQQIQSGAREAVAEALASETEQVLDTLQAKADEAGNAAQSAAAQAIERAAGQAAANLQEHQEALTRALQEDFPRIIAPQVEKVIQQVFREIFQSREAHLAMFEGGLQTALRASQETALQLSRDAGANMEQLQTRLAQLNEGLDVRAQELATRMDSVSREAVEMTRARLDALLSVDKERCDAHAEAA